MRETKYRSLALGTALATLFVPSGSAYAVGEQACESEVAGIYTDASMADITATPAVPVSGGALRVDWSVHTESESARGFCKVTKGGDVVRVKTLHHKTYKKSNNDEYDGFYYDEHIGKWRDDSGEICHTCTPDNGFPNHAAHGKKHEKKSNLEQQMEQVLQDSLSQEDIENLRALTE
ncbi:MAG: hypothetical protein U9Q71_09365 [Pseudomonadota bacterium]|nr:hypothetical protein [Pseudomonadota bacterium]